MGIFSKVKNLFGDKPKSMADVKFNYNGKTYDAASLANVIGDSSDKSEIKVATAVYLAMAKVLLDKGQEKEARDVVLGIMGLVNNRNDNVFNLEDVWEIIDRTRLKDFTNNILGTQL